MPVLGGLLFYGGLVLANELIRISRELFALGAPYRWLFPMLGGILPEVFGFVLPMAAVLGGLWGSQSLSTDSELLASQGLGVGSSSVLKAWALLAGGLFLAATLNAHWLVPAASRFQGEMKTRMVEEARTAFLQPGGPPRYPSGPTDRAIWMATDGRVHLMERSALGIQHLLADKVQIIQNQNDANKSSFSLSLQDLKGALYQPTEGKVILMNQQSQSITFNIPETTDLSMKSPLPFMSTPELFLHQESAARVELSRRFTLPLATAALLLMGIALGVGHARFQRGGPVLKSLGLILLYYLLLRFFENRVKSNDIKYLYFIFILPFVFFTWGLFSLRGRFRPHRPATGSALLHRWATSILRVGRSKLLTRQDTQPQPHPPGASSTAVLTRWSIRLWFRNWGGVLGSLLVLDFLMEYANLAEDLARQHLSIGVFLAYWAWNLPPFLVIVLPMAFLLGGTLVLSEAALSQEWTAIRAGGGSLLAWCRLGLPAWGLTLVTTLMLQVWIAPWAFGRADTLYRKILDRPPRSLQAKPWLHLGSTGVLWHLEGMERWGFPLHGPDQAPLLLHWRVGEERSEGLPWGNLSLVPGPLATQLFPHESLRISTTPEGTSTPDLLQWQRWAPDAERAVLIWERILGWLAGPCLLFGMVASAFPRPREGRGRALGSALAAGLAFFGLQALFGGAARAGQIPAPWGVASPLLLMLAFGLIRLRELRT
jgi:lipopolysaccharide export LptBFGC system permease protein LptF